MPLAIRIKQSFQESRGHLPLPLEIQKPVLIFPSIIVAEQKATITCIKLITFRRYENPHCGREPTVLKKKKKLLNSRSSVFSQSDLKMKA